MHEALGLEHLAGQGLVSLEDLWRKHTAKTRIARLFELPGRTRMLGGVRGVPGNRAPISILFVRHLVVDRDCLFLCAAVQVLRP